VVETGVLCAQYSLDGKASLTEWVALGHTRSARHGWVTTVHLHPHTGTRLNYNAKPSGRLTLLKQNNAVCFEEFVHGVCRLPECCMCWGYPQMLVGQHQIISVAIIFLGTKITMERVWASWSSYV